jgi:tetratricopeptide (TPR) repeat protein/predicted nucleic acid-binding protein
MVRVGVPGDDQDRVLLLSRRRCCICSGLYSDFQVKLGQIAHLDHDNSNCELDNLAFLCLEHHDVYDSKSSQSKNFRLSEVKYFRDELYKRVFVPPSRSTASLNERQANVGPREPFMSLRIKNSPPANEADFERLCLTLLKAHWQCPTLELYGRRGEHQQGIDIIDMAGAEPLRAAQCKLYDTRTTLPPAEIKKEVRAAVNFSLPLGLYAICTTAKVSTKAQQTILTMNQEHREKGLFAIELFTWDRLDELLEEFPAIRDEVYRTISGEAVRHIEEGLADISVQLVDFGTRTTDNPDALHSEIDEARDLVRSGDSQAARLLLQRLRTRKWDRLDARHRYRLLANIGATYLSERNFQQAAQNFIEASRFQPEDSQAAENEALAYYISMPAEEAHGAITKVRKKFPQSPRVNAYWIATNPPTETRSQIEKQLDAPLLLTPEVISSLSGRALSEFDFEASEQLAARAIELRPEWSFPRFLQVRALAHKIMLSRAITSAAKRDAFRSSLQPLAQAIDAAAKEHDLTVQTLCLLERFQTHLLLDELSEAESDLLSARELSPDDLAVKKAVAELSFRKNDHDKAVSQLREIKSNDHPEVALLLAEALRKRGTPVDVQEAIALLMTLVESPNRALPGGREYVASILLLLLGQSNRWPECEQVCDTLLAQGVSPALVAAFRARNQYLQNSVEAANRLAGEAVSLLRQDAEPSEVRWVAQNLSELERHAEALPLWQRIASVRELTDDTKNLLDCAMRLGRDDLILEICAALRANGVLDHDLILYEVQTLEEYDVSAAITALQEYLHKHPDDIIAKLRLSMIGLNWNRQDVVDARLSAMPPVADVSVQNGRAAIQVMKMGGHPNEALAYAYELLRLHFNDAQAHRAYTFTLLPFEPRPGVPECSEAKVGCAVCYVEDDETQERWIIIEDSPDPDITRSEYPPDHALSLAVDGKKVGDKVTLSVGSFGNRSGTIRAILSKYVFRYQDSMQNWQIRFPDAEGLESIKVMRTNKEGKEEFDPSPLILSMERLAGNLQRLKERYATAPIPIHMLGEARGKGTIQTTLYLAQQNDTEVYCCIGAEEERRNAIAALDVSGFWIIEPSALATIFLLDLESDLAAFPVGLVLSQGTVADFDEMLQEDSRFQGEGGLLVKHGDGIALISQTPSDRAKRVQSFTERINKVKSASKIVGCVELAKLQKQHRELMNKAFGEGGAESIILAATPGHLLWTDDLRLAGFAKTEHGVKSAWTQVVLQWAAQRGHISEQKYIDSTARLIGYGYSFTSPNLASLIAAAEMAEWDQTRWPFSQALNQLGTEVILLRDTAVLSLSFLTRVYRETILDERRRAITVALMDKIGNRQGGTQFVQEIKKAVPLAFGLNVLGEEAVISAIDAWLNSRTLRIIQ